MGNSKGIVKRINIESIDAAKLGGKYNMNNKKINVNQMCIDLGLPELTIPSLENEEWKELKTELYPNIIEGYYISNKNRVYNLKKHKFLSISHKDPSLNTSPYFRVCLTTDTNGIVEYKDFLMHRLMMAIFKPTQNMDKLSINHIDGNKLNNNLDNLEWCTVRDNTVHALNSGLFIPIYGENHCCATITEQTARDIINMLLLQKYSYSMIAYQFNTSSSIVNDIAIKKSWKHLTKDIPPEKLRNNSRIMKLTGDDIMGICSYFENNAKPENMSIREYCKKALKNIQYKTIGEGILNSVRKIYTRERFTEISCNYNF